MVKKNKANAEIRQKAKSAGICLWQVADVLGMDDANFCRKMRHELVGEEKQRVLAAIKELSTDEPPMPTPESEKELRATVAAALKGVEHKLDVMRRLLTPEQMREYAAQTELQKETKVERDV